MLAISLDMHLEITEPARIVDSVKPAEPRDLRLRHRRNLALVRIQRRQPLGRAPLTADRSKSVHERCGFPPWSGVQHVLAAKSQAPGELQPEFGMIRIARFLVNQVREQVTPRF